MTRRVLIGTGVVVLGTGGLLVGADRAGRLDDAADAVGLDPKPLPDPDDTRILRRAATATVALRATVDATAAAHPDLELSPVAAALGEQVTALGGLPAGVAAPSAAAVPPDAGAAAEALEAVLDSAARSRTTDAETAGSAALVRVLASLAAGHAQAARAVRRAA